MAIGEFTAGSEIREVRPIGRVKPKGGHVSRDDDCLVFLHIPKTAGSSLATSLVFNYPPERTVHVDLIDRPAGDIENVVPTEDLAHARLIRGHLPYGVHTHVPRRCEYITVLREPVARAISAYKFILRNPAAFSSHPLHDPGAGGKFGLEGYLESEGLGRQGNRQVRMLSAIPSGDLGRDALETAKHNLERFLVVGLTERFEETFVLVRRALKLRVPFYATRLVGPPLEISDRAKELIREQNLLDLELYEFGRDLFARQVAQQGRSFRREARAFRAMRPFSRMVGRGRVEKLLVKLSRHRQRRHP
jgi:hypothetical protein